MLAKSVVRPPRCPFFFFNDTATTEIYTLSLHDALPISRAAAQEAMRHRHLVLAAGGGAFAQPATREVLRKGSVTVWLRCDLPTILSRVPADGRRPLAANRAIMRALLAEREPSYQLSEVVVDTSEGTPEAAARQVLEKLGARGIRDTAR